MAIRICRAYGLQVPLLNSWLTDFVFIPIIAHFSLSTFRLFTVGGMSRGFSLFHIIVACLYVSIVYEGIYPRLVCHSRADFADVLAYFGGGIFYFFIHQRSTLKRQCPQGYAGPTLPEDTGVKQ